MAETVLFFLILVPQMTSASRILLIPSPHKGHVNFFTVTAGDLQDSGHEVAVLTLENRASLVEKHNVKPITYLPGDFFKSDDKFIQMALDKRNDPITLFKMATLAFSDMCVSIHENKQLIRTLEDHQFDIAIVDGVDYARCIYSIPYRLGLKYITITARHDPWNAGIPSLPSVEGLPVFGATITADSSFIDRVKSLILHIIVWYKMPPSVLDDDIIAKYAPRRPRKTFGELFRMSEMWLVNMDTICLQQNRLFGYHYQFIAGMSAHPPKPLPEDIQEFINGSKHGFAVFTLGSGLSNIPKDMLSKVLTAFGQVEYNLIMRHDGEMRTNIPNNIKILPWIPQNDLLGHPKALVFVTHGGANGQMEALYHKIPMISFPMFGDQPSNAESVERKGFSITLDKDTFTSEELVQALNQVAGTDKYRQNIQQCSDRFSALKASQPNITFWVEHVIQFGADHIKPVALHVPLWKMFMLDIVGVVMIAILIIYSICLLFGQCMWRKCHQKRLSATKKNK